MATLRLDAQEADLLGPGRARFQAALGRHGVGGGLARGALTTVQVNVGKVCNQACLHCHVEAGPTRTESMSRETADRVLALLAASPGVGTVDITGGAPELNPSFRHLVRGARALGRHVLVRHNLTVAREPGQEDLHDFFAAERVEVIASMPCYGPENVDAQRGDGVFDRSIAALLALNARGYARQGTGLALHLVYNPLGPSLPPDERALEADYKRELGRCYGVVFDRLLTLANMPIKRFAHALQRDGRYAAYLDRLEGAFNPATVDGLMCRSLVSVGWDGRLYDCDFNQMLAVGAGQGEDPAPPRTLWDLARFDDVAGRPIAVGGHCFGCTAGAGSSCGGALAA